MPTSCKGWQGTLKIVDRIVIVGSGASGVHFALSALQRGYDVTVLDVGFEKSDVVNPDDHLNGIKSSLADPVDYFLGRDFEGFISPDDDSEYYGFPPNKKYVFLQPSQFRSSARGFSPLFSFAQGGLAEVWTGGSYPLNDDELVDFPFSFSDLAPYYSKVAERIGISGEKDDLERFYPFHDHIMEALPLDQLSKLLLSEYEKKRASLNEKYRVFIGRSRVAALSQDKGERKACRRSGRCLWGCPHDAFYTPSLTLKECKTYSNFHYIPDVYVTHFQYDSQGNIRKVVGETLKGGKIREYELDRLVLAAGTLSSSKIFMESIYRKTGNVIKLRGLMDNRQVLLPFVDLIFAGEAVDFENYQYHQLAMTMRMEDPKRNVHGQITTLKSALIHPIVQSLPFDLKTALFLFRNFHSALGLINLNFSDDRRDSNYVSLDTDGQCLHPELIVSYTADSSEAGRLKWVVRRVKRALLKLGCLFPPGMTHIRPMGASVHYSGTIPMSDTPLSFTASKYGQSTDFKNLFFADGTTFPFLPAKNLTFTLMANAIRVAEKMLQ